MAIRPHQICHDRPFIQYQVIRCDDLFYAWMVLLMQFAIAYDCF